MPFCKISTRAGTGKCSAHPQQCKSESQLFKSIIPLVLLRFVHIFLFRHNQCNIILLIKRVFKSMFCFILLPALCFCAGYVEGGDCGTKITHVTTSTKCDIYG